MREPRPRHTLQVIRVPSLEVQDLGLTSLALLQIVGGDKLIIPFC